MEHSQIILETLQKKNISAYKLAKETGISESLFSKWKKHPTSEISSSNLERIASYLGCSVERLLGQEEESERVTGFLPERLQEAMGNMSCEEFAQKLEGNAKVISLYLEGRRKPTKIMIRHMAMQLGVNPDWLCGFDAQKNKTPTPEDGGGLSKAEQSLISLFRQVPDKDKEMVTQMIEAALKSRGLL